MKKPPLIFGREPVIISNAIEGFLAALLAFGMLKVVGIESAEEIAVVMAVVSSALGLYVAYCTKDTLLGAVLGFVKAGVALVGAYGYNLTDVQLAQLLAAIAAVFALWHQRATGPAAEPSLNLSQHSVEMPPDVEVLTKHGVDVAVIEPVAEQTVVQNEGDHLGEVPFGSGHRSQE